jgi:hypothetical protein
MCEPTTIALALSATATVAQGFSAKQKGKFDFGVAKFNARQLENEATQTKNVGVEEENRKRRQTAELLSRQRVQLAAQGVELGSGSAEQLQQNTIDLGEVDALRVRSNFELQAQSREDQAGLTLAQGKAAKSAGNRAFLTSLVTAGGTALIGGGGGQFASKWFGKGSAALAGTPTPFAAGIV